jgi:hypothetical protein
MKTAISVVLLSLALGAGTAFAQTATPAPAAQSAAPMAGSADRKAISKSCTDQANAKGLHGKERKRFRSDCKKNGGKAQ